MNILCWIFGHKENEDINEIDFKFNRIKNAVSKGKIIGTVNIFYQLKYCDRCKQLFLNKEIEDNLKNGKNKI